MNVEEIKRKAVPILKRYGVARAGVFGSVARGDAGAGSDVDILVELPKGASLLDLTGLKIGLEGMLGNEVDVLTYNSLYPLLKERILSEEVAILLKKIQEYTYHLFWSVSSLLKNI